MEDNLNIFENRRRPQFFQKEDGLNIFQMKDDLNLIQIKDNLNILANGIQPQ